MTAWWRSELAAIDEKNLRRRPPVLSSANGAVAIVNGKPVLVFCSNDYLGLASDPRVADAGARAAAAWGAGSGASRQVSGSLEIHRRLEEELASWKGAEDSILFSSGYLANIGTIPALVGEGDAVFSDENNHASIIDGCRLSKAANIVFPHRDYKSLDRLMSGTPARRRLIVTDSVFSMDGDSADLPTVVEIARRNDAMVMVDEAHAAGLLGPRGAGAVSAAGLSSEVDVVMGTLSKALGSSGGYVAGKKDLMELLRNRARSYVFDTAPNPASAGAALKSLEISQAEPWRRARALEGAKLLAAELKQMGYRVDDPEAAIIPVIVGDNKAAMDLSSRLLELGIFIPAIRPPSVADGTARLRATVTAGHTPAQLDSALEAFALAANKSRTFKRTLTGVPASPAPRLLLSGGVFITGTDTGVGKTVVAAALARCLWHNGIKTGYYKPVQTGLSTDAPDSSFVADSGDVDSTNLICRYEFQAPLAPKVAAKIEGLPIDLEEISNAYCLLKSTGAEVILVEGAGGLLVPIDDTNNMADVAARLDLPIVVVARPSLGTLNHTGLTVEAARRRGLEVMGVILCRFPQQPSVAEATNGAEIEALTGAPILGVVPEIQIQNSLPAGLDPRPWLAPVLGGTFDRAAFLTEMTPVSC